MTEKVNSSLGKWVIYSWGSWMNEWMNKKFEMINGVKSEKVIMWKEVLMILWKSAKILVKIIIFFVQVDTLKQEVEVLRLRKRLKVQ